MTYNHYKTDGRRFDTFQNGDGWYWIVGWEKPFGPFETEREAVRDARRRA